MNLGINGKKALVTGGTRGIGEAVARELLAEGVSVTITGQSEREGWWSQEANCSLIACDFSNSVQLEVFCEDIRSGQFDILVNNSGAFYSAVLSEIDVAEWDKVMAVNLTAPMLLMKAVCDVMGQRGWGRIVNVGSIAGIVSRSSLATYSASKAGLAGLTRAAALDLAAQGVLVNYVCPAYTETDMLASLDEDSRNALLDRVPLGRFSQPVDIAAAVLFLASDRNQFITGQSLVIDGGVIIQ
ncbi:MULTISPECIES: SDR family NAD(P)-dependent oxidoreductase [unclassified Lentimonas]|uniref:SDR family NAD(P)-dependent oxidoreductase n=1 Tax=unclassified Lentimonas TaxID=2630993 RepID=UPI001322BA04|nr:MULTISPECIES: SDR family NAD(P)-dependent oxidoreductase [unclassified Lentimonas]CAA6678750.1 3-oxoacyl-[acyl-carrier protein] reductase (EC [Lentimonas sp. CC4]CAA6683736.1 3-oxoacyl-[acyl-carrier protein] reductase (EC [Lentimonas sp. CC6]CAA7074416.1 3-oxoacyl-[acyl-carrier protein] reductase (EC [Lentimonas sp. CC4]CAA7169026.1 3-oxoacyl-[acyl-carrier protein] reductase (EC [Lentimonas sp. CC21]CAA7180567.1 3-oxoacyl-[acyl-carrier protein] reductase (EC [Lentimonas sp. CC8]